MRVSIIVPLADWSEFAIEAVNSILNDHAPRETRVNTECVLVAARIEDAESVKAQVNSDQLKTVVHPFATLGEAASVGMKLATGDWIGTMDADSRLLDKWRESFAEVIARGPDVDIVCSDYFEIDQNSVKDKLREGKLPTHARLLAGDTSSTECVIFKRSLLVGLGGFDETLQTRIGFELLVRATNQSNPKIGKVSHPVLGKRVLTKSRRATASELQVELARTNEAIGVLRSKGIEPGDAWLLGKYATQAQQAGMNRLTGLDFDRYVYLSALKDRRQLSSSGAGEIASGARMLCKHMQIEAHQLLKRPKYAKRLMRKPTRVAKVKDSARPTADVVKPAPAPVPTPAPVVDDRPAHRIFQLRYNAPAPCELPSSYFRRPRNAPRLSVSIVTPNLNQGPFIERTIKSVVGQDYPNLEYVVQDGCSTDQSVEVIRTYEGYLAKWQSVKDKGQSHAINLGLERTTGDIMAYLNSDDILLPGSLAYVADFFERHPDIDVVYGDRVLIDEQDKMINYWVLPDHDHEAIAWADFIPQETMFWRRSAWDAIGSQVDDSFHFAMDWDMILRFRAAGKKFAHLRRFLGAFRITDGQKTNQLLASVGMREMGRLRQRELGYIPSEIEVSRRMGPYVKQQRVAERRFDMTQRIARSLWGTRVWSPDDWAMPTSQTEKAAA